MEKKKSALLLDLFITFLKIGSFTVGGGLAMLPVIEREIADRKRYISHEEIVDAFAVAQSLPGVIAANTAIYVGYRVAGFAGAVVSALGAILPSFVIILVIAILFTSVSGNVYINKALTGAKAGITGIIAVTIARLGKNVIKDPFSAVLAVGAFILTVLLGVSIVVIVASGALLGFVYYYLWRIKRHDPA